MCGFAVSLGGAPIDAAMAAVSHRGTRSSIVSVRGGEAGHVRLPIVGVGEENDQPIQAGPWTIMFVGEILDFRIGSVCQDECDVQTVARLWLQDGPRGFIERDGFWSIAAVDSRDGSLHLLTDYLSQKPTYYRADLRAAASEPAALAALGPATPDEVYFASVLKWGYCPEARRTPYHEVKRVLPGEHVAIYSDGSVDRKIVDPLIPVSMSPEDLKDEVKLAVCRRVLSSDVPVAALVSGGLDSSITYALAKRYGDVRPYFVEGPDLADQWEAVQRVTGDAHVTRVQRQGGYSDKVALRHMQEPIDLGSLVPQVALSSAITEDVCLTGDGADELFGGYGRSQRYDSQASDVWHELVCWHLPRLDRVMMRNRVEVRSPFLARRVAAAALDLPRELRTGKKILRDLFRHDLPLGSADAPKVPLRTKAVEVDREARSIALVDAFRQQVWG